MADEPEPAADEVAASAGGEMAPADYFAASVLPYLKQYCHGCHAGKSPKGAFPLDQFNDFAVARGQRSHWLQVAEMLEVEGMPPDGAEQPPAGSRGALAGWIREHLAAVDCVGPRDPGRVTIRRLNRAEYRNTVRDLVGVDYRPTADFPADDVAAGFDTIADALSLPPVLMEKFLTAAAEIAAEAIVAPETSRPPSQTYAVAQWSATGAEPQDQWLAFYSAGAARERLDLPAGRYRLALRACGDQAGDEPPRLVLKLAGQAVAQFDVTDPRDTPGLYEATLAWPAGPVEIALEFSNDYYRPEAADGVGADRNLYVESLEVTGPLDAPPREPAESHRRIIFRAADSPAAIEEIVTRLATRAFRRPARAEEVARLIKLVELARQQGESVERGLQLVVEAVLVSPYFLFRIELDEPSGPEAEQVAAADGGETSESGEAEAAPAPFLARDLNPYELATRLSYFLWSSMPDEELLSLAGTDQFDAQLETQVRRMIADPRSSALVENFGLQWLTLRNLDKLSPDPERFPTWDEDLRSAMRQEAVELLGYVMREDRSLLELLDAPYGFVNERLARHYGLAGVVGPEFRQVVWTDDRRGGVLGLAGVLAVTSNPTRTSPVKRGKWVLEQLLGSPPPPPPPNVPELSEDNQATAGATLRERMEAHRANPSCAACHAKMDPLGFGLENFNAIGGWRDRESGSEIDASGELPDGSAFRGPAELRRILVQRQAEFRRTLAQQMLVYALGRSLADSDQCAVDELASQVAAAGDRSSSLILGIVRSDPFRRRRLGNPSEEKTP